MLNVPSRQRADSVLIIPLVPISQTEHVTFTSYFPLTTASPLGGPNSSLVFTEVARDKSCKRPDRIEKVYELSTLAHHQGLNFLILIDSLTQSQLSGNVRPGRSPYPSIILVSIHSAQGTTIKTAPLVAARRLDLKDLWQLFQRLNLPLIISENRGYTLAQSYFNQGLILADPHRSIFDRSMPSQDEQSIKYQQQDQIIHRIGDLPTELAQMITTQHQRLSNPINLTDFPSYIRPPGGFMHIQMLIPASAHQLNKIYHTLKDALTNFTVNFGFSLHIWQGHAPASRQELYRLFERYFVLNRSGLQKNFMFIDHYPLAKRKPISVVQWDFYKAPLVRRVSFADAYSVWYTTANPCYRDEVSDDEEEEKGEEAESGIHLSKKFTELLLDYDGPFFHDPPRFVPGVEDGKTTPVFQLTTKISEIHLREISSLLGDMGLAAPKRARIIDWICGYEGSLRDMWRITWECYRYRTKESPRSAVFIDSMSITDKKVAITELM